MIPRIDDPKYTCLTCYWFQFPTEDEYRQAEQEGRLPPLRNRMCHAPPITAFTGVCPHWRHHLSRWERVLVFLHLKSPRRRSIIR